MRNAFLKAALITVSLGLACPAIAADFTFKFAHSQPESSVRHKSMLLFKDELEKASGGQIAVEVFGGSLLGSEPEVMDMVKMGAVQGTRGGAFTKANKKFLIYTLPFLYENTDSVLKAMRSDFGTVIADAAKANGYYIPATGVAGGFRQITNNARPINTPDDVVGLKIRTPGIETIIKTFQALEASPTSIPYGEVYMALKMGVADGEENPPSNITEMKFYEAQKYISLVNYQIHPDPMMVNLKWYEGLPEDLKVVFDKAAKDAMKWSDEHWLASEADYLKFLSDKLIVNEISTENRVKFIEKVRPVWDAYVEDGTFTAAEVKQAVQAGQ
ncbi:TRAP transporter substrate-binding protein [Cohaesibacter celericrescens]|uniref:TRAP transporter substrate-binding protein DctP n=1 Tax=Cohaesibacter celericrescens TaxID=2067669 RepID=A0A2N5XRL4_9HYPH|nr:TRAP transporter substrate-binding protein [Cohaesibacter celericrescens]PLW77105.1 TRAP transporter substrate-binding protein DctP [Cohaesibacter celericrescens]